MGSNPYKDYLDAWDAAKVDTPQYQPEPGVYGKYISPAITHVGRFAGGVLGAPLLREAASVVHGTFSQGDPLADFKLTPSGAQQGPLGSILGRYGIGDEGYTPQVGPYEATVIPARKALTEAITGEPTLTAAENDPGAEAAFSRAHPWMTTAETVEKPIGDLAFDVGLTGGLGVVKGLPTLSKAPALSPAMQLLARAGEGAKEGVAATKAGAALTQALGGEEKVAAGVRGLGHLFVPGMVAGAAEGAGQAWEAAKRHPLISPEVAGPAVSAATDATFAAMAGLHLFRGGRTPKGEASAALDFDPNYKAPEKVGTGDQIPDSGLVFAEEPVRKEPLEPWQDPNIPSTFDTGDLELDPGWRRAPTPDAAVPKPSKADQAYLDSLAFEEAPPLRDVAAQQPGGTIYQPPPGTEEIGPPPAPSQELIFKAPLREPAPEVAPETLQAAAATVAAPAPKGFAELGYTQEQRNAMSPSEARAIIAEQRPAASPAAPPQVPPTSTPSLADLPPQPTPVLGRPEQLTLPTAEEFAAESAAAKATAPPSLQVPPGARNKPAAPELAPEPVQTEFPEAAAAREAANQAMAARQAEVAAKRREAITSRLQDIKTQLDVYSNIGKGAKGRKRGDPFEFLSKEDQATVKSLRAEQLALRQEWNTGAKETRSPRQIALAEAKARREAGARNLPPVEEVAPDVPKEELDLMLAQAAGDLSKPLTAEDRARLQRRWGDEGGPSGNRASKKELYGLQALPDRPAVIARAIREDGDNPLYLQAKHLIAKNLQEGREEAVDRVKGELEEEIPPDADSSFNPDEFAPGVKKEAAPTEKPAAEPPTSEPEADTITLTPAQEKLANELGLSDDAISLFLDTTENFERELESIPDSKTRLNLIAARRKFLGGDLEPGGKEEKYGKLTAEEAAKAAQGRSTVEPSKLQSGEGLLGKMKAKEAENKPPPPEEPPAPAAAEPPAPTQPPTSPAAAAVPNPLTEPGARVTVEGKQGVVVQQDPDGTYRIKLFGGPFGRKYSYRSGVKEEQLQAPVVATGEENPAAAAKAVAEASENKPPTKPLRKPAMTPEEVKVAKNLEPGTRVLYDGEPGKLAGYDARGAAVIHLKDGVVVKWTPGEMEAGRHTLRPATEVAKAPVAPTEKPKKAAAPRGRDLAIIEEEILWAAREGKDLKPLLAERAKQLRVMGMPLEEGPLLARDLYDRLPRAAQKRLGKAPEPGEKLSTDLAEAPQDFTSLVDQLKTSMGPNISSVKPLEGQDGVRVTFKGGREIDLLRDGNIRIVTGEGGAPKVVAGSHQIIDGRALVNLHEGSADFVTLLHELGHDALSELLLKTGGFNSGERTELFRANGFNLAKMGAKERAAAEEVVVQRMAEEGNRHLKTVQETGSTKGTPGWFRRVWNYITNLVTAFKAPEYQDLVKRFAEGRVFNQGLGERLARAAGEKFRGLTRTEETAPAATEAEAFQAKPPANLAEATEAVKAAEDALAKAGETRRSSNEDVEYRAARQALAAAREAQKEFLRGNKVAPIKVIGKSQEAPQPDLAGTPEGPGGFTPKQVEHKVAYLRELEQSHGIKAAKLARDYIKSDDKLGQEATRILETQTTEEIFRDERPSAAKQTAMGAILRGRAAEQDRVAKEIAFREAKGEDAGDLRVQGALASLRLYGETLAADTRRLLIKDVNAGTELSRALRARSLLTTPAQGDLQSFLRAIFKKIPNISEDQVNRLAAIAEKGDVKELTEAIHAATNPPLWKKYLEGWKSGLVSAVGTLGFANPGGNIGELLARTTETEVARPLDWLAEKAGLGERTRSGDEAVAERQAVKATLVPALKKLVTEDLGKIWRGEDWRPGKRTAHELLDEVPAIGPGHAWIRKLLPNGHLGNTIRIPLNILSATDLAFRRVAMEAELAKLSTRAARQELGPKASSQEIQARAAQIDAEARGSSTPRGTKLLDQAEAQAQLRVFQGDPDHVIRAIEQLRSKLPILHVALPFTRTPWNIFKLMIERSPLGGYSAIKSWKNFYDARKAGAPLHELESMRDKALDLSARAALGSTIMGVFFTAAQAGLMTGNGPTDPKRKKALMDTGWQPYSFKLGDTYIPFNRFEPVSSILGFAADAAELGHVEKGESYLKKAAAAFMTNALSKTYLQGLSESAAALLVDPTRYLPGYAANLAGSVVPNIVAKGAQAIDPVLRETNAPDEGVLGQIGRTIQSRIPGASTLLPERRTATGDVAQRTGLGGVPGALSRFALPVQVSTAKPGKELEAEFSRVGYVPPIPDREIRVGGQSLTLSDTEHQKLLEEYRKADVRAEHLLASPSYQSAPDDAPPGVRNKTAMLQRIYNDANTRFRARYAGIFRRRALAQAAQAS